MSTPVVFEVDADRVGWIVFDDPENRANVLDRRTRRGLAEALTNAREAVRARGVRAVVLATGKERIFIAGADLREVAALADAAEAEAFSREGQALSGQVATFPVPVVAAIRGACAGGGCELALACDWRVAAESAATRIGLPELGLGTIPGWGGGVRLARRIGAAAALEHLFKAQLLSAKAALAAGLVEEVVPAEELKARAKAAAVRLAEEKREGERGRSARLGEAPRPAAGGMLTRSATAAQRAAVAVVEAALTAGVDAWAVEGKKFGEVAASATCKNQIYAFNVREQARKRTLAGWFSAEAIEAAAGEQERSAAPAGLKAGLVGAGVMGSGIAQWLAAHGVAVVLRDVDSESLARGLEGVRRGFDEAVARGKITAEAATAGRARVRAAAGWGELAECDLVIEAIVEDVAAKRALFGELAAVVRADALLASNTSALPIEEIAGHVSRPERTLGLHFFNPVSRMPLVELVLGPKTSAGAAARALALVKALGKQPVICRSAPGFLMTRVLFFYLNEACRCRKEGVPTESLDAALRAFGWPMGPLRLIDEVGVDVTAFIFGELAHYFPERFRPATVCTALLAGGCRGRKNGAGAGFYTYAEGREGVNPAAETLLAGRAAGTGGSSAPEALRERLMRVMVDEAARCLAEGVVRTPEDVDFALLAGAGFPAAEGGLMRWARTRGWF